MSDRLALGLSRQKDTGLAVYGAGYTQAGCNIKPIYSTNRNPAQFQTQINTTTTFALLPPPKARSIPSQKSETRRYNPPLRTNQIQEKPSASISYRTQIGSPQTSIAAIPQTTRANVATVLRCPPIVASEPESVGNGEGDGCGALAGDETGAVE